LLKVGRLSEAGASDERKGVRGGQKALSRKLLAGGRGARGLHIVFILVCIGAHNEDAEIRGDGFERGIFASLAIAAEHQVAEMRQEASFGGREEAVGYGEFGEDAADFVGGNQRARWGDEFAREIARG